MRLHDDPTYMREYMRARRRPPVPLNPEDPVYGNYLDRREVFERQKDYDKFSALLSWISREVGTEYTPFSLSMHTVEDIDHLERHASRPSTPRKIREFTHKSLLHRLGDPEILELFSAVLSTTRKLTVRDFISQEIERVPPVFAAMAAAVRSSPHLLSSDHGVPGHEFILARRNRYDRNKCTIYYVACLPKGFIAGLWEKTRWHRIRTGDHVTFYRDLPGLPLHIFSLTVTWLREHDPIVLMPSDHQLDVAGLARKWLGIVPREGRV